MDASDINKLIAEKKGLKKCYLKYDSGRLIGCDIVGKKFDEEYIVDDYINDPALILELQMELLKAGWLPDYLEGLSRYYWINENIGSFEKVSDKHFGTATAMAWLRINQA